MKYLLFSLLSVPLFSVAVCQKKEIPADLSVVSVTLENATITKQPPIVSGTNGTQQPTKPVISSNPALKCTVVIRNDYNDSYNVSLLVTFPSDATILTTPANCSVPFRQDPYPQRQVDFGHMTAGQTATVEFTFATAEIKRVVRTYVFSIPMDNTTANNYKNAFVLKQ